MVYVCEECGKTSPDPQTCHGQAMVEKKSASYKCESCGNVSDDPRECCGQDMKKVEE